MTHLPLLIFKSKIYLLFVIKSHKGKYSSYARFCCHCFGFYLAINFEITHSLLPKHKAAAVLCRIYSSIHLLSPIPAPTGQPHLKKQRQQVNHGRNEQSICIGKPGEFLNSKEPFTCWSITDFAPMNLPISHHPLFLFVREKSPN